MDTKKKPRGKPFTGKNDPRRSNAGQRSREVVATQAQARALYVQVLHEPINVPPSPDMSNLELIVRQHVAAAKKGDAQQREQMFDRIWGKATQPVDLDVAGKIQHEHSGTLTLDQLADLDPDELARRQRDALGTLAETKRRW